MQAPAGTASSSLSPAARGLWAKTGSGEDSHLWLPLYMHAADALGVARLLWDEWLPESVRRMIADELGCAQDEAGRLVACIAGLHDMGKATPAFQCKVPERAEHAARAGLPIPLSGMRASWNPQHPHALMGEVIVKEQLCERGWAPKAAMQLASVVGGHHGTTPNYEEINDLSKERGAALGTGAWEDVRGELLGLVMRLSGVDSCEQLFMRSSLSTASLMVLTGLVIMADWIASNADLFPLVAPADLPDDGALERRAREGWDKLGLPGPWRPVPAPPHGGADAGETGEAGETPDAFFHTRFSDLPASACLRPAQLAVLEAACAMDAPGLLIVEAPMGSGKTEASLLAAEVLAGRFGEGGLCYLLPTMATSNAMFARVERWLGRVPDADGAGRRTIQLMHSKAALNGEFQRLRQWGRTWMGDGDGRDGRGEGEAVIAHQWFGGRKRGLLAPFVVGTVDQLLMAALRAPHVQLRLLGLAGKAVVVDEVHAYDAYMNVYLDRALDYLGALGVPVVLLSATLPPSRRAELVAAYRGLDDPASKRPDGDMPLAAEAPRLARRRAAAADDPPAPRGEAGGPAYPLVTVAYRDRRRPVEYRVCRPGGGGTDVSVGLLPDGDAELVEALASLLSDGGCACVLRDTVARAQHAYDLLKESFGGDVVLVHSRFVGPDRAANDARLLELLGPGSDRRPRRLVVVGTQVIEQSLDIDFDVMVSDVAPVDLLLQRMGRLHRHARGRGQSLRPPKLRRARLLVTGLEWPAAEGQAPADEAPGAGWPDIDDPLVGPPGFARGVALVYRPALLLRTVLALGRRAGSAVGLAEVRLPGDIAPLVEEVYEPAAQQIPEAWQEQVGQARQVFDKARGDQVSRADNWLLVKPSNAKRCRSLDGLFARKFVDGGEEQRMRAAVRDAQESVEVVVVERRGGLLYTLPGIERDGRGRPLPQRCLGTGDEAPDDDAARLAATCTVCLPPKLSCNAAMADAAVRALELAGTYRGWQESRWLRGALPLVLDERGHTALELEVDDKKKGEIKCFSIDYSRERGLEVTEAAAGPGDTGQEATDARQA